MTVDDGLIVALAGLALIAFVVFMVLRDRDRQIGSGLVVAFPGHGRYAVRTHPRPPWHCARCSNVSDWQRVWCGWRCMNCEAVVEDGDR